MLLWLKPKLVPGPLVAEIEIHAADLGGWARPHLRVTAASSSFLAALVALGRGSIYSSFEAASARPIVSPLRLTCGNCTQHKQAAARRWTRLYSSAGRSDRRGCCCLAIYRITRCADRAGRVWLGLAAIGVVDDLLKLAGRGVLARPLEAGGTNAALVATVVAGIAGMVSPAARPAPRELFVPLVGSIGGLGWLFIPLAVVVIVGLVERCKPCQTASTRPGPAASA